ncbi:MAG: IgA Peptidase M64 [Prolixibacteraceae bacterium]|nr:IgA Peptidase M64 [Prolixibacteraceae bacterium]
MIRNLYYLLFIFFVFGMSVNQVVASDFDTFFKDKTVRFDYQLCGNVDTTFVVSGDYYTEGNWAGSRQHLTNELHYGNYIIELVDSSSQKVIYSTGFSPLFQEWKSTAEAKILTRAFSYAFRFPMPKNSAVIRFKERRFDGSKQLLSQITFNPNSYFIIQEELKQYKTELIWGTGEDISSKVDVVMLADGYTQREYKKFIDDSHRMVKALFKMAPYDQYKDHFNFIAVFNPSQESGCDISGEHVYKNTTYGSSFYTFDISRYLTARDMRKVYQDAATVPYDQIYVLVNTKRYGGGGFYNSINLTSVDHPLSEEVFIHEFGHGFAGLADEYYTSSTAFDEQYYNLKVEPWEPNITTLVDFDSKWAKLVAPKTPIPTPRIKKYNHTIGAFEGGGYMSKGIFSPRQDCRMKTNTSKGFCKVCQESIARVIMQHQ